MIFHRSSGDGVVMIVGMVGVVTKKVMLVAMMGVSVRMVVGGQGMVLVLDQRAREIGPRHCFYRSLQNKDTQQR